MGRDTSIHAFARHRRAHSSTVLVGTSWSGPTIVATVIASLGFLIAAASLGWQITRWRASRRARIRLRLSTVTESGPSDVPGEEPKVQEFLVVTAFNEGERPTRVVGVGMRVREKATGIEFWMAWPEPPDAGLPGAIEPYDEAVTTRRFGRAAYSGKQFQAWVDIVGGRRFSSDWYEPDRIPREPRLGRRALPISKPAV
jgi:hypothetical protein